MANERDTSATPSRSSSGPELRLLDRRAFVGFPSLEVAPGLVIKDFALQIPDVSFPFNVSGGASRYQKKKLEFGYLELALDAELVSRSLNGLSGKLGEVDELKLHFRPGYLEGQARLTRERTPLTFKVAFDGDGERLALYLYDVRLYGFSTTPAPQVAIRLSQAVADAALLPEVEPRGASGFTARVLPALVQLASVGRGYKLPTLDGARLAMVEVSTQGLKLRFASGGLPPPATHDEELLLALEGARAFSEAELLLSQGKLADARHAYLRLGDAHEAHPFAAERLLTLLVADPQAHEMALDVAASLSRRRERSATAIWAEAVVRERAGESARAAERYLALCAHARKAGEESSAFYAAESAARAARDQAPQMAVKALHELLGLRPDHLPSLRALARAADQSNDRAGAIRAYRRIAALAREPADAADAHVHMAALCAQTEDDVAGARLHCEAALRLQPDNPDALFLLGELCHRSGEHLRALKALDRLRDVALDRHEVDRIGRSNILAGRIWEEGLKQDENALLRYREAATLLPGDSEPLYYAARVAERLGKLQEALAGYQQAIELAGPTPRTEEIRKAAHGARHALARLARSKLGDPLRAREHLEAALALDGRDRLALDELIPYFRASGRTHELVDALEKSAAITEEPQPRAALWAEAGELCRSRLSRPDAAERFLRLALDSDPRNRTALEGMLTIAEARREGPELTRCLRALAELAPDPKERARLLRRLAVAARDLAFDLDLAVWAFEEVLAAEGDDLPALGELCALQRRRADMAGLASALDRRAAVAEAQGDKRLAGAALRELGQLYEARLGRVAEALVCLEKAARLAPEPGVLLELAELSMRCEKPEHARRALEDLLALLPPHAAPERKAEVRARLGRACELLGDLDAARDHYAQAFPLRRLDDELSLRLEALYEQSGQLRELAELWASRAQAFLGADRAVAAAPLFQQSALALLKLGERELGLQRLTAALEAAPEGPDAAGILERMAALELERGAKGDAARLHARRAALLTDDRAAARLLFTASTLAQGTPRETELLDKAQARDLRFAPVRIRRAELLLDSASERALEELEVVLGLPLEDPDAPDDARREGLLRLAGQAALKAGRLDAARRHLARLSARRPEDLEVQRELATLHRKAGAREALCDLLGELWARLPHSEQLPALREHVELCLALNRRREAEEGLRELRTRAPEELWAPRTLLALLESKERETTTVSGTGAGVGVVVGSGATSGLAWGAGIGSGSGAGSGSAVGPGSGGSAGSGSFVTGATAVSEAIAAERLELLTVLANGSVGSDRAGWLAQRARHLQAAGRRDEAREDLRRASELSTSPVELLLELAALCQSSNDFRGELSAWRDALSKGGTLAVEAAGRRLPELARTLQKQGELGPAREAFSLALGLGLGSAERGDVALGLSDAALAQGDVEAAAQALHDAAKAGPLTHRVEAHRRRASLLEQKGDLAGAAVSFEGVLGLVQDDPEAARGLVRVLRAREDWAGLTRVLAAEAARVEGEPAARLYAELGLLQLDKLSRRTDALASLRRAVSLGAQDVRVWRTLVRLLVDGNEHREAADLALILSERLPPAEAADLLWGVGESALKSQEPLTHQLWRRAHALAPAQRARLVAFSELALRRGDAAEALALFDLRLDALDPNDVPAERREVLLTAGELAQRAGELERAEGRFREVFDGDPLSSEAAQRLSSLLERRSPRDAVEILWRHVKALPPSKATHGLLLSLVDRAETELADSVLCVELLRRAAETATEPLPLHRRLASHLRTLGRGGELLETLQTLAALCLESGDPAEALQYYEQEAALAERLGRVDEALKTLRAMRDISEDEGNRELAAEYERRRAELLRDAKLDLVAADLALEESFDLHGQLSTTQMGAALAERRQDAEAQVTWLERALPFLQSPQEQGRLLLELSRLHEEKRLAPSQAEAALREALTRVPGHVEAERRLLALLEREDRWTELAQYLETKANAEKAPATRAALFLRAAELYREKGDDKDAAAAALLAARGATPDDVALTAKLADTLHELGRPLDASEFDAVLLELNPLREPSFSRQHKVLRENGEHAELAALMLRRAERQTGPAAAESFLEAASAYRALGAKERAWVCEEQAFEQDPSNDAAFTALRRHAKDDPRKSFQLLARRAEAVPSEAATLLRESAGSLRTAGELLLAAQAFDALLEVAGEDVEALSSRAELAAEAGGPLAAKPYDRRLLAAAGNALPVPVRVKTHLRLGHASLSQGAFHDAADALETVVSLDPEGDRGQEALSLLAEVHARTENTGGLYRTTLQLARRARTDEAEALYRRAAELWTDSKEAIDALLPLAKLRPTDTRCVDRAADGLLALGRHGELVELLERTAESVGGATGAERLLRAARLADGTLGDAERAVALTLKAAQVQPDSPEVLREAIAVHRRRGDTEAVLAALSHLASVLGAEDQATSVRLELAALAAAMGRPELARESFLALISRGPASEGYATALDGMLALLDGAQDAGLRGRLLEARAELQQVSERGQGLLDAARAHAQAGALELALRSVRAAQETSPGVEPLLLEAELHQRSGDAALQAEALERAARVVPLDSRPALLLQALEARERAGQLHAARDLVERLAADHPAALPTDAAARHLERLGAPKRAAELGFESALRDGDLDRALHLADGAREPLLVRRALLALTERGSEPHARRLWREVELESLGGARAFSEKLAGVGLAALAEEIRWSVVGDSRLEDTARSEALNSLLHGANGARILELLHRLGAAAPTAILETVLVHARELPAQESGEVLAAAAELLTSRRGALLREVYDAQRLAEAHDAAAVTLGRLIAHEKDSRGRAALAVELGELFLHVLSRPVEARAVFQRALADDPNNGVAVSHLLNLFKPDTEPDRFIAMAERLTQLAGEARVLRYRASLIEAYSRLGRIADAYRLLCLEPETPETILQRIAWAEQLGLRGEALALQERTAKSPGELASVLEGYLDIDLIPSVMRLGEQLVREGALSPELQRRMAEQLAVVEEGAPLAAQVWGSLLASAPHDADGWTLFALAVRGEGRHEMAALCDGVGAALSDEDRAAEPVMARDLELLNPLPAAAEPGLLERGGLHPVTAESMPRLHAALAPVLEALGLPEVRVLLDSRAGVDGRFVDERTLLLGMGVLAAFGTAELGYFVCLLRQLGESAAVFSKPGATPTGLTEAVRAAFRAYPSSLAALRVLAHLDARVRGGDPTAVKVGPLLLDSDAFAGVAADILALRW